MTHDVVEEIRLTLPRERAYFGVAHLVLGGLALRLNFTIEELEDLQLAVDSLLDHDGGDGDVTLSMRVAGVSLVTRVGPFSTRSLRTELERAPGGQMTLRRVLDTVVEDVRMAEDDSGDWVEFSKRLTENGGSG